MHSVCRVGAWVEAGEVAIPGVQGALNPNSRVVTLVVNKAVCSTLLTVVLASLGPRSGAVVHV